MLITAYYELSCTVFSVKCEEDVRGGSRHFHKGVGFFYIENKIWFPNNKKLVLRKIKRNRYIVQTTHRIYIFKSRNNPMSKTIDFFFQIRQKNNIEMSFGVPRSTTKDVSNFFPSSINDAKTVERIPQSVSDWRLSLSQSQKRVVLTIKLDLSRFWLLLMFPYVLVWSLSYPFCSLILLNTLNEIFQFPLQNWKRPLTVINITRHF